MVSELTFCNSFARYANMDTEAIKLDRYAKFRKIGHYEEFLVRGGKWKEARKARKEVFSISAQSPISYPKPNLRQVLLIMTVGRFNAILSLSPQL